VGCEAPESPVVARLSGRGPSADDLGTTLASDKAVCMVRPVRQQSSDATFHAGEKNFMSKGRDGQKGAPNRISYEDREDAERTQRTEPRR
jgi:hypothetical protein